MNNGCITYYLQTPFRFSLIIMASSRVLVALITCAVIQTCTAAQFSIRLTPEFRFFLTASYENCVLAGKTTIPIDAVMQDFECQPCSNCRNPAKEITASCDAELVDDTISWTCSASVPDNFNVTSFHIQYTNFETYENETGKRPFTMLAKGKCEFLYKIVATTDSGLPIYTPECDEPIDPRYLATNGKLVPGGVCDPFYYERLANIYDMVMQPSKDAAIARCCQYNYRYFRDGDKRYRICQ